DQSRPRPAITHASGGRDARAELVRLLVGLQPRVGAEAGRHEGPAGHAETSGLLDRLAVEQAADEAGREGVAASGRVDDVDLHGRHAGVDAVLRADGDTLRP